MEKSIMSLLEELESRGVTAEDLEKAASVRLFEKAAAAEGVDLDLLDVDQVEDLYAAFLSNQPDAGDYTKEASAMNDEIIDLFEKTAAAEGIDLDEMADDELAELYNHYVENVLPVQIDEYEKEASYDEIDEATEKLAEAEILGRHMARAYMDEMDKEAASQAERDAYKAFRQAGLSKEEAFAKLRGMQSMGAPDPAKQRAAAVKATKKRIKQRKKNPGGTQRPRKSGMGQLAAKEQALAKKQRRIDAEGAGARRVKETREAARKYVTGKYRGARSAVGKRQIQLGRLLGGTTRSSARLRGGLGMAGAGLATAGAGYGGYRAMSKKSSYDDFDVMVDEMENILLEKVAYDDYDDDEDTFEDLALEQALENLYDAGFDLDELV